MATCRICGRSSGEISEALGLCAECIRSGGDRVEDGIQEAHARAREGFGLPLEPPRGGRVCRFCVNACGIPPGGYGYCGVRRFDGERLTGGVTSANVSWYHDPLPTNCVADWVCPGGTGAGYPQLAHSRGPEYGYKNLAVFYQACSFDCLYCQNWQFRALARRPSSVSPESLAGAVDQETSCICYFGGDPTPQLVHSLLTAREAKARRPEGILRICWETNGSMNAALLQSIARVALSSGGCIKFDLKAWNLNLHRALCGAGNERTLKNFRRLVEWTRSRPWPPPVVASTLLVPGYVGVEEVSRLAKFISGLGPEIPYSLLAFYPTFHMSDLPRTSAADAQACTQAAKDAGLRRVRVGNQHLLR
jgi:pyruvate formate lyase activating enzyme